MKKFKNISSTFSWFFDDFHPAKLVPFHLFNQMLFEIIVFSDLELALASLIMNIYYENYLQSQEIFNNIENKYTINRQGTAVGSTANIIIGSRIGIWMIRYCILFCNFGWKSTKAQHIGMGGQDGSCRRIISIGSEVLCN